MSPRFGYRPSNNMKKDPAALYRELDLKAERALAQGDLSSAEKNALKFQQRFPQDAKSNLLVAQVLVAKSQHSSALPYAERAVRFAPLHPGTNYFLGRLYIELALFEKAAPHLTEGLKNLPDSMLLNWAMGDMQMGLNKGEAAIGYYERALALRGDEPLKQQIRVEYAWALAAIDRPEQAAQQFAMLRDIPGIRGFYELQLSNNSKTEDLAKLEGDILSLLHAPNLTNDEGSALLHAFGNVKNRMKQRDEAFEYWQKGRSFMGHPFAIEAYTATIDNLIKFYSKDFLDGLVPFGDQSERPVFIFGMARSGTTLAEQIVAAHPLATGVGELGRMSRLEENFFTHYGDNATHSEALKYAANGGLKSDAENYLNLLRHIVPDGAQRVVDKAVAQFHSAGYIHACFPNAKFIHCDRHPADSYVSALQNRLEHDYVADQTHYAQYYLGKQKIVAHWKTCFPDSIFELSYEKLVKDPEHMVRELIAFLGLEWDDQCMKFFEQKSTVQTLSVRQVRQPIYTSSIYKWMQFKTHLSPLLETLRQANFAYPEV